MSECSTCEGTGLFAKKTWDSPEIKCDDCNGSGEDMDENSIYEDIQFARKERIDELEAQLVEAQALSAVGEDLLEVQTRNNAKHARLWKEAEKREAALRVALEMLLDHVTSDDRLLRLMNPWAINKARTALEVK